jgi:hypothetical protein
LGALWFSILDEDNNFYLGAAINHLNQPNLTFYDDDTFVSYYTRMVFHAGGEFRVNESISLIPGAVTFLQGPSFELNGGASVRFKMGGSASSGQTFQIGAWTRIANHFEDPITWDAVGVYCPKF